MYVCSLQCEREKWELTCVLRDYRILGRAEAEYDRLATFRHEDDAKNDVYDGDSRFREKSPEPFNAVMTYLRLRLEGTIGHSWTSIDS